MKRLQGFILGIFVSLIIIASVPNFADTISVVFNSINLKINGVQVAKTGDEFTLDNGDRVPFSISYKGTTYLPLRKVGDLLNKNILWDGNTKTVSVNDSGFVEEAIKPEPSRNSSYYEVNDILIDEAILEAEKGFENFYNVFLENYSLEKTVMSLPTQVGLFINDVNVFAPYVYMVSEALEAKMSYSEPDRKLMYEMGLEAQKSIILSLKTQMNEIDSHKFYNGVLIQEGKVIKATEIRRPYTFGETSSYWPDNPAYRTNVVFVFPIDQIDMSKNATFVLTLLGDYKDEFLVELPSYK